MKNILIILLALLALSACRTTRTITQSSEVNVLRRDSLVIRDSVVLHHLTAVHDSVIIRDSIVIIKDSAGRIIGTEHYHIRDRVRNQATDNAAISKSTVTHDGTVHSTTREVRKTDSKSVAPSLTNIILRLAGIITLTLAVFLIYKTRMLWKWW